MRPLWSNAEQGVQVVRLEEPGEIETLVRFFEGVADAEEWQHNGALRLWIKHSVYFALEVQGQIAGGLQLVVPNAEGTLPCQNVWPEVAVPSKNHVAHIAILALDANVRGKQKLFWPLTAEMWRYCVGERIATLYFEVTPRVQPLYQRLGWPLVIKGERRIHWGEDCYLCTLGIPEVAETLLRRAENSLYYQQIVSQMFRVTISASKRGTNRSEGFQAVAG